MIVRVSAIALFLVLSTVLQNAYACPEIEVSKNPAKPKQLVDFNVERQDCGRIRILHVGDSNVDDFTDRTGNGAWPGWLKRRFDGVRIQNAGIYGITARQYLRRIKKGVFRNKRPDICIVGPLGINEVIKSHGDASLTERDLRRIAKELEERTGCFAVMTQVLPIYFSQFQKFQRDLNSLIKRVAGKQYPILSFRVSQSDYQDNVHPGTPGYKKMANQARRFIQGRLTKLMRAERPDSDGNGFSDAYEARYPEDVP